LETFKKTLPSASLLSEGVSFLQRGMSKASALRNARAIVAKHHSSSRPMRLLLLALNSRIAVLEKSTAKGKAKNFGEVIVTIDNMVDLLGKDQAEDDKTKEWCTAEFDTSDDDSKRLDRELQGLSADIQELGDKIITLGSEITSLQVGIKALDKAVVEATEQRKEEHTESTAQAQMNQAAKDLLIKAKNRMSKFYAPSEAALAQTAADQPEAPDTGAIGKAYEGNSKSAGVLAMMDQIVNDLAKDMREAEYDEKEAQTSYNEFMKDSQDSRSQDAKSITDKEASKAHCQGTLDTANEKVSMTQDEYATVQKYIRQLHSQCDFLRENYDIRKEARAGERDGLNQAKAMLSGAGR